MVDAEWFVPGGAVTTEEGDVLRLRLSRKWTRVILEVPRVPPSMNTDQSRSWRSFYKHKRSWQTEIETLLMIHGVKPVYQRAIAGCFMRFPRRASRRDPSNFRAIVDKALGDALTTRQVIPDDDAPHYHFGGVEFAAELGDAQTMIHVFLQPKE